MIERSERERMMEAFWSVATVVLAVVAVLLLDCVFARSAQAACRPVAKVVQVQTQFIAVPVATPLGLPVYAQPVASAGLVAYGAAGSAAEKTTAREAKSVDAPVPPSPDGKPYELYLREFQAYLAVRGVGIQQPAASTPAASAAAAQPAVVSAVQQHCASCHNATKSQGGLDLTAALSAEQKLKAMQRLVTDDEAKAMPKGKTLTDQQRGELVSELLGKP